MHEYMNPPPLHNIKRITAKQDDYTYGLYFEGFNLCFCSHDYFSRAHETKFARNDLLKIIITLQTCNVINRLRKKCDQAINRKLRNVQSS